MVSRHGLSEIYVPPLDTAVTAFIVFVHGLFGHPSETWTWNPSSRAKSPSRPKSQNGSSGQEQMTLESGNHSPGPGQKFKGSIYWPRDLLPKVVPDVRIFTWGYDADIAGFSSASRNTIHQHAGNLLSDLVDLRAESEQNQKPIIFVVHSLGGIIVKAALNLSKSTEGTSVKDIGPATSGICFLGTPHRGSRTASIGKIAFRITKAAGKRPNTKILQGLERNSETLDMISDDFSQTIERYRRSLHVHSFREEKFTKKWGMFPTMVVDTDSAKIGLGHERTGSIPADHSNMTKFDGIEDVGFKRVSAQLRRWVDEKRHLDTPGHDEIDCMNSLNTAITKERFFEVEEAHGKTFAWLFDPTAVSFSTWLRSDVATSSPIYWVQGKPGSGKSTLMKYAINDARTWQLLKGTEGADWSWAAFFFHDRGYKMQKSLTGMLQELVGSLLGRLPELFFCVEPEYTKLVKAQGGIKHPTWDLSSLKSVLFSIVEQRKVSIQVILFLDALDEHAGDNDELAQILKSMIDKVDNDCVTLRLCLASRSWSIFEHYFGKYPGLAIHEHTQTDIEVYTRSKLEASLDDPNLISAERLGTLTQQITRKALGVFIWVCLVVEQLAKGIRDGTPYASLEDEIAALPEELADLYAAILRRLDPQYVDEAYIMLHVALSTLEPLPLKDFMSAVNFVLENKGIYADPEQEIEDAQGSEDSKKAHLRRLASRSRGLLEAYVTPIDESTALSDEDEFQPPSNPEEGSESATSYVQFLHATAKEYAREHKDGLLEENVEQALKGKDGNDFLFLCSVSCRAWVSSIKKHMLSYIKLAEVRTIDGDISVAVRRIVWMSLFRSKYHDKRFPCTLSWWIDQHQDLSFKRIRQCLREKSIDDPYLELVLAVAANAKTHVQHLLQIELVDFPIYEMGEIIIICLLQVAAAGSDLVPVEYQDRIGMIKILLDSGYPTDHVSPSVIASYHVVPEYYVEPLGAVMARKLDSGYNKDIQLDIARYLLTRGADPNCSIATPHGSMALLSNSVLYGSAASVRLLLQYGAHRDVRWNLGLTANQCAILRQDKAITQALKEAEDPLGPESLLDLDVEDRYGYAIGRVGLWMIAGTLQSGPLAFRLCGGGEPWMTQLSRNAEEEDSD